MIRLMFNIVGTVAALLGILGIFVPLLPTTPFLLLASACFLRGSDCMHAWLVHNRFFGKYLDDFQSGRGIPLQTKILALTVMWISLAISAWLTALVWLKVMLLIPGIGVTIYLARVKTRKMPE